MESTQFSQEYQDLMDEWHEADLEMENAEYHLRNVTLEPAAIAAFKAHIAEQEAIVERIVARLQELRSSVKR